MKWLNKIRAMLLGACLTAASSASALTVYDPWNHIENIQQLAQQVQQVQQAIQLVSQGGQMLNLANLNQMSWVIDLVNVHQQQGSLSALQSVLGRYYQSATGASGAMEGIYRQYQYSNVSSWDEYMARERTIADANRGVHTAAFQHASETLGGLEQQHRAIQDLSARTDTSVGTMQLLQTLNKHMNVIATQNTQMLGMLAQQRQEAVDEREQEVERIKQRLEQEERYMDEESSRNLDGLFRALSPNGGQ